MFKSRLVTADDFEKYWFKSLREELDQPDRIHRKVWENVRIVSEFEQWLDVDSDFAHLRCLGFGVGLDPIPSWLASQSDVESVLATDLSIDDPASKDWLDGQHCSSLDQLYNPKICTKDDFYTKVQFQTLDMNHIPLEFESQFDFTWSCGSLEHIGGIDKSIDFFYNQMKCLKPGGLAVHTTEYNLTSNEDTIDAHNLCLLRKRDIEQIADRVPEFTWCDSFDWHQGESEADTYIAKPPHDEDEPYHLKLQVGNYVTTSILLVATKNK